VQIDRENSMIESRDRPDVREQIAVAGNANDLSPDSHAATVNGALGAAAMRMVFVPESGRMEAKLTEAGTAMISPSRRMSALLERARYAGDRQAERPAALLFAHFLGKQVGWVNRARLKRAGDLLFRIAALVVTEWIHDRCAQCGGGGFVRVGKAARNSKVSVCGVCQGNGRGRIDIPTRMTVIGVDREAYKRHWEDRLAEAHRWLADIEASNMNPLQRQLRRDIVPPAVGE
jgi:hypothetical protein